MDLRSKYTKRFARLTLIALLATVYACYDFPEPIEEPPGELNSADLESVVFLGGSAFSGIHSGALTSEFSSYNIPDIFLNTLAQNDMAMWESFSPLVETENGFNI